MIKLNEDGITGELYLPECAPSATRPLVVTIGGSGGGFHFSREVAKALARSGHSSLALAYFGLPGLPEDLRKIPLEYFRRGWRQAQCLDKNGDGTVVVIGRSRGAELALLLGAYFPEVRGVVAYAPSNVAWSVFSSERCEGNLIPSWTLDGESVPFVVLDAELFERHLASIPNQDAVCLKPWFNACLELRGREQDPEICVECIKGPILLISGLDDQLWPSSESADTIAKRLREKSFPHQVNNLQFSGAGHCFDLPTSSFPLEDRYFTVNERRFCFGGEPESTLRAQRGSWEKVIEFLDGLIRSK